MPNKQLFSKKVVGHYKGYTIYKSTWKSGGKVYMNVIYVMTPKGREIKSSFSNIKTAKRYIDSKVK